MKAPAETAFGRLGVIWPDTGEDPSLFEMARAEPLNRKLGSGALNFDVAYSKGPPGHSIDALYDVGDVESVAAAGVSLAEKGAEAVVWACTSGSFIGGFQWSLDQRAELAREDGASGDERRAGVDIELPAAGYRTVDVLSPYPEDVSEIFLVYLEDAGLEVASSRILHSEGAIASANLRLMEECRVSVNGGDITGDVVMIPDTAVNSLWLIPGLEAVLASRC